MVVSSIGNDAVWRSCFLLAMAGTTYFYGSHPGRSVKGRLGPFNRGQLLDWSSHHLSNAKEIRGARGGSVISSPQLSSRLPAPPRDRGDITHTFLLNGEVVHDPDLRPRARLLKTRSHAGVVNRDGASEKP